MTIILTGDLEPISNRADWRVTIELTDDAGAFIDLTGAAIKLSARDKFGCPRLTGDETDGHIVINGPGTFTFAFPASELTSICAGQYSVGITVKLASGVTHQIIIGTVSVLDGVVAP